MIVAVILIAAGALQAASQISTPPDWTAHHSAQSRGSAFVSPMGEPFFGRTVGEDGLVVWFQQADRNHDGVLTADEMAADADRFFLTLDVNHDGDIDPDEIARYETVIAPEIRTGHAPESEGGPAEEQHRGGHGRYSGGGHGHGGRGYRGAAGGSGASYTGGGGGGADDEARAGRYGLLEIPEPVASADADMNRGVSAEEFHKAAIERFQLLDVNHTGKLTLPDLKSIRSAATAAARRPAPRPGGDPEDRGSELPQD